MKEARRIRRCYRDWESGMPHGIRRRKYGSRVFWKTDYLVRLRLKHAHERSVRNYERLGIKDQELEQMLKDQEQRLRLI